MIMRELLLEKGGQLSLLKESEGLKEELETQIKRGG
jgi:hypothetical protein